MEPAAAHLRGLAGAFQAAFQLAQQPCLVQRLGVGRQQLGDGGLIVVPPKGGDATEDSIRPKHCVRGGQNAQCINMHQYGRLLPPKKKTYTIIL